MLKYIIKNYINLYTINFLGKGYSHVSDNTNDVTNDKKEKIGEKTTSNDYTKKGFFDGLLYRGLKNYLGDNQENIGENKLDLKEIVSWTKELTNKILKPINSNGIKNLIELENLLVETYGAGKKHNFVDKDGKEKNIRFATSFNFAGTTILRNNDRVNAEGGVTDRATHNLSQGDLVATDALGWSSIPDAPTGGYLKTQEGENSDNHENFGFLGKILEFRPMSDKFNKELYEKVMNMPINITFKGFAYESSSDEIVIMPTFLIEGEEIEKEIQKFSEEIPEGKIEVMTSKNYLANL